MMRNLAPGDLVKKAWDLCNQDWPGCSIMNMMHWKVIVFGGAISFYSVSCMSDVIFNPSLLNWSSLILTVAHIKIMALTLVLSFHPDSICQGAPPKSHASFVTGPETSLPTMGQPVTPQSWKLQLTMSLITITSFFPTKKKTLKSFCLSPVFSVDEGCEVLDQPHMMVTVFPIHKSIFAELAPLPSQISTFWSWWISCMVFHSALHLIPQAMDVYHGEFWKGLKSMKFRYRPMDTQTWQDVSKKWLWWVVNKKGARMLGRCGPGICIDQGTVPLLLHESVHVYNTTCHFTSKMVHSQS